jgi:hypothetical protein
MTEALPMDIDFEFTVIRLAKIANTKDLSVYGGTKINPTRSFFSSLGSFIK